MTQSNRTKSTRSQGTDGDSSHNLFTDLLRRAASPEVLAGVAGAAAAAHFTKHAVERSDDDESDASAEPAEDEAGEEGPEAEQPEDEETEQPEDEEAEQPEAEQPEDEQPEDEGSEDEPDDTAEDDTEPHHENESLGEDDEHMQLLSRARQYAQEFTGHPVESFSGLAKEEHGWRIGVEVVEVARVPSTTDVLCSYEVVLTGDGELVDFRRAGRYYRNATDGAG